MRRKAKIPPEAHETSNLEKKLPIGKHLTEARSRLLKCLIAVVITTAISFPFARHIFAILESRAEGINLIYIEMTEMLGTYFRVAFVSGLILALPFLVYQLVMFIRPGLSPKERRYLYFLLPGVIVPFIIGIAFGLLHEDGMINLCFNHRIRTMFQ